MTDPIYPWLDPIEVRRLAEGLMRPQRESAVTDETAGVFQSLVTRTTPQPALTPPAPLMSQPDPPAAAAPPVERSPLLDGILRFRDWMRDQFGATDLFILDREGAVIFDESSHGRLHFLARSLALGSRRQGASSGNVHVKIGAGATLEVIPVDTAHGCLVLGALVPQSLPPASVAAVIAALTEVASSR